MGSGGALAGLDRPFIGLRPFEYNDRDYFFGRDDELDALELHVRQNSFVSVVGRLGCGKSSLISAGLRPRLEKLADHRWHWIEMRPGEAPAAEEPPAGAPATASAAPPAATESNDPPRPSPRHAPPPDAPPDRFTDEELAALTPLRRQYPTPDAAAGRLALLAAECSLPKGTVHVISDVHGEDRKLRHVLNNASGSLRPLMQADAVSVALPDGPREPLRVHALDFPDGRGMIHEDILISTSDDSPADFLRGPF